MANIYQKAKKFLKTKSGLRDKETDPAKAYDLWAGSYDNQTYNLMLDLDNMLFRKLLNETSIENKIIADIGCGTGRHWPEILSQKPAKLLGYDVSAGMLDMLNKKYPEAETFLLEGDALPLQVHQKADIIISTLTLAHVEHIEMALSTWNDALSEHGEIIITDYHPRALENGANRTFVHDNKVVSIRNFVHPIEKIKQIASYLKWEIISFDEKVIDETMKHYYQKQNALHVYEKFKGIPIIYGMHLKKKDAAS